MGIKRSRLLRRFVTLQQREQRLLDLASEELSPAKIDRQAFAYDNLYERYHARTRRAQRIQRLTRRVDNELRELTNDLLSI